MADSAAKTDSTPSKPKTAMMRDWTKGSIPHNLWSLSWPMLVSYTLMMIGPTIDMVWVGKLGAAAIGGVGVAGIAVLMVDTTRMGLLTGLRAMIARSVGDGDTKSANHASNQAFIIVVAFSVLVAIIGMFYIEQLLAPLRLDSAVVAAAAVYLRIQFIGSIAMSFRMVADAIMQASGDTVTPMKIALFFRLLHVVLCPFLVFGWWIFPRLEVAGAATTAVISQSVGMIIGLWILYTGHSRLKPTLKGFRVDLRTIGKMVRIGIPSAIMGIQNNVGQLVFMSFLQPFGTLAVAAHSIGGRVENVITMPSLGFGMSAGVIAGQNLGAGHPERAQKSGWWAVAMVQGFMFLCAVALLLFPGAIISVFDSDPALVALGSTFLRIAAVSYLVMGLASVISQCVSVAGDTVRPMIIAIIAMWGVQIPLAWYLSHSTGLGVYGIRWGIVAGVIVTSAFYFIYFRWGNWKTRKI